MGIGVLVKQRVITNIRVAVMSIIALAIVASPLASAQTSTKSNSTTANVLKISPVRSDIEVPAGTSKTVQVTVTNLTDAPITVKPVANDFIAGDERGTPALILDADKFAPTHSLKRFMAPLSNVTVPAKQMKNVDVVIIVPKDAQPGGYYGAVRFMPADSSDTGQVNLTGSAASLILLTVPGDTIEKLELTDFAIQQGGTTGEYFQSANDLQTSVRFQNKGNVQIGPFGKITVKQGNKIIYETDFNNKDQRDMILPDSARRWDISLKNIGSFGNYTVSATFSYGKKNQTIEVTKSFWVVPQTVIIVAIVSTILLILLIIGIWLFIRSRRRRNMRAQTSRSQSSGFRRF